MVILFLQALFSTSFADNQTFEPKLNGLLIINTMEIFRIESAKLNIFSTSYFNEEIKTPIELLHQILLPHHLVV